MPLSPLAVGPEEAASMTGHTRSGIYIAIANGELNSFKSGKRRLILVAELRAWIERKAKEGAR
ncbi:TPA: helix-turn-helix domain-containing protein [Pseudomonas aeruginosa]